MFNLYTSNRILATLIFFIFNIFSLIVYSYGLFSLSEDSFLSKFSEFLYIFNFILIGGLIYFYRVKLFSPQGLFFISCSLFTLGRVFLSFFDIYRDYYELYWGQLFYFNPSDFYHSLIFWQTSISSFMLGSLILSTRNTFNIQVVNLDQKKVFLFISIITIILLIIFWFPISYGLISTFMMSGYEGLYEGQTEYNFGYQRLASLLLPIMAASGILSNNKKVLSMSLFVLALYVIVNLLVGQRALLFVWVLIGLWLYNLITKKELPHVRMIVIGIALMVFAQFLESFRGGRSDFGVENPIAKFIYVQSLTYILPSIVENLDNTWPILTYVTMFFPVAGISSLLGFVSGTHNFSSGAYFAYSLNPYLFENGFGLGWSVFLDLYILGGRNYFSLAILAFVLGVCFCLLIEKAKNNIVYLYLLMATIPAFMFAPRSLMYSITSSFIYALILYFIIYFIIIFGRRR